MAKRNSLFGAAQSALKKLPVLSRKWRIGLGVAGLIVVALLVRGLWTTDGAAQSKNQVARVVPVETALAERKKVPVRVTSLGSVTPIASVAIKARVDTAIMAVHFRDGQAVKKGTCC